AGSLTRHDQSSAVSNRVQPPPRRRLPWPFDLYQSAVGKKWVMAVSGIVLMGYVFAHMVGNLKVYLGAEELNHYAEWLREVATPALPRTVALWLMRSVLAGAFILHIHAAYGLTVMNRRARLQGYVTRRDYEVADFAGRTMRWTGVIIALFVVFHLLDLTWGTANPDFVRGDPYHNLVVSFSRVPVAAVYVVANVALAIHLYHGAWSLFRSLGMSHPRLDRWTRRFAVGFAGVTLVGNVSFPIAVQAGWVG
ncbi:MAG: succinate dehydrogenase cytochrome b subunit, partial [Actinomycetota bacterium]|nr:succinate dehydrogenase cytochrome b subunit [Actinomycetota bacterium]